MYATPSKDDGGWERFQKLLDEQMDWPSEFVFKFIVPQAGLNELKAVFGLHPVQTRSSRAGNYVSITARMEMHSSHEIIAVYKAAAAVKGVILL